MEEDLLFTRDEIEIIVSNGRRVGTTVLFPLEETVKTLLNASSRGRDHVQARSATAVRRYIEKNLVCGSYYASCLPNTNWYCS